MTKFVGRKYIIGLAKEGSRGTATPATLWLGRNTISFNDKIENAREEEALGRIEDSDANFVTGKFGEGDFEFDLDDRDTGLVLTSLLGASPSTGGGGPYTHTYTLQNNNQHQSVSVTIQDPDTSKIFPLGVVDSLQIQVDQNAIVKGTVGFMSSHSRDWTAQTEDYTSRGQKFLHQHAQVRLAANIAGLSGATPLSLKNLTLNINTNTIKDDVLGTVAPEDILNQQFSVDGTLTLNKEDETFRNYMLDGTYRSMEVRLERDAASSVLTLQFPRVDFTEWETDPELDSIVTQSINFKGNYDAANGLAIISTATLVNQYDGTAY